MARVRYLAIMVIAANMKFYQSWSDIDSRHSGFVGAIGHYKAMLSTSRLASRFKSPLRAFRNIHPSLCIINGKAISSRRRTSRVDRMIGMLTYS